MSDNIPPHPDGLPYPGPIEVSWVDGRRVVEGYHATYILAGFDERLRLSISVGIQLRILTLRDMVALAFMVPHRKDIDPVIILDHDWFSAIGEAEAVIQKYDDSRYGPVEGKEQLRALRRSMN